MTAPAFKRQLVHDEFPRPIPDECWCVGDTNGFGMCDCEMSKRALKVVLVEDHPQRPPLDHSPPAKRGWWDKADPIPRP